ncbi:hypothetical protein ABFX02_02G127300 [Erythranthe guttata]
MEIKEYSEKTIRLFGVDIPVHPNTPQEDHQVVGNHSDSPSDSSTTPSAAGSPNTVLSLNNNQEKHVPDQSLVPSAAAAGSRPSSDEVPAKSPAKKTAEFHEFDIIDYYPMMAFGDFRPVIFFPAAPEEVGCSSPIINYDVGATSDPKADNKSSSDLLIIRSPSPDDVVSRKPQSKKRVSGSATYTHDVSPLLKKKAKVISNEIVIYSPKPLQSFPPSMNRHHDVSPNYNGRSEEKKKMKGKLIITDEENVSEPAPVRKKRTIRRRDKTLFIRGESSSSSIPDTVLPLEEIPGMIETIESHNGSKPVFLYHKKLETSDVWDHLNRLNINTPEILMSLLRDEERIAVTETRIGVQCIGIDKGGRSFNLHLGKWPSLQMIVINKQWGRIVNANNAVKGDWVEIWGYRVNGSDELRLVINFRKQEEIDQRMIAAAAASTSSSSTS